MCRFSAEEVQSFFSAIEEIDVKNLIRKVLMDKYEIQPELTEHWREAFLHILYAIDKAPEFDSSEVERLESRNVDLQEKCEDLEFTIEDLKGKVEELNDENESLITKIEELQEKLQKLTM